MSDFYIGYINFGWDEFDEETKLSKRIHKLNKGRTTMIKILGIVVHKELSPLIYRIH